MLNQVIKFFLENKVVTYVLLLFCIGWGVVTAPFDWEIDFLPSDPVAVDAIPDIGENQQIVFTEWTGRSPQDVEDQVTYPLTTALLGIPGVRSVRSNSMFGFSSIYLIFEEDAEFYWSRSRILEKLNSLPANLLPGGVQPTLGPDATALGQIFWYTIEGRDRDGHATGGWDLHEIRSVQDFYVRYALSSAEGVAEVASVGGYVQEYQVDVDPNALKLQGLSLADVMQAVRESNIDVGAQTIEINQAEYFVRGLGYIENIEDIGESVIRLNGQVPVRVRDVAKVNLGPASRRGILDKSGAQAVGGVVVARFGSNPLAVINAVKDKISEIGPGMPQKTLSDGTVSQLRVIPFYDRTQLINETIGTLEEALKLEVLITIIVVILLLLNLKSSLIVSVSLPIGVLMCFIAMRYVGVDANIVALSGIAIAIGTMVDMGIVLTESITDRMEKKPPGESLLQTIYLASAEVGSAVLTALATTVVSFLPVFAMEAAEGKLFRPLAFTKTFALVAAVIVALCFIPALAHQFYLLKIRKGSLRLAANLFAMALGIGLWFYSGSPWFIMISIVGLFSVIKDLFERRSARAGKYFNLFTNIVYAMIVGLLLAMVWMPLGVNQTVLTNLLFISLIIGLLLGFFYLVIHYYDRILAFLLRYKIVFILLVCGVLYYGFLIFQDTSREFMPSLDEGSFLLMPTTMPHAGIAENEKNLRLLDMAVTALPEVEMVVGKAGRVESALDPAPMSMYENVILYKSEYKTDENGRRARYRFEDGEYIRDGNGNLIPDRKGKYFRQWRDEIRSPDDIWDEVVRVTKFPGVTSAPRLQPIETRLVMLQTGMRAPMGIKVRGSDLDAIESFGLALEPVLREVEGVKPAAVFADRVIGKPYLLIDIDRERIAQYGLTIQLVQNQIQAAIGGMSMGNTVEGRERYRIRLRYPREYRNDPGALERIFIQTPAFGQVPLGEFVDVRYEQGPQSIKSEDGFLVSYVLFDRLPGWSEGDVVDLAREEIEQAIADGRLELPSGVNYAFAGNYEQQVRANRRLGLVIPIALGIIFLILYLKFRSVLLSLMVFTGVFIAFAGGFIMIDLYGQEWFMDVEFFGTNMRDLFRMGPINLSVAVWVGFLALFGIATDDGVLVGTFLQDQFKLRSPDTVHGIREAVIAGGLRRVRPAMMTTATTILALLPVLSSTGRGADIMIPMAIPCFGGMVLQVITMFTVPVLYALHKEIQLKIQKSGK